MKMTKIKSMVVLAALGFQSAMAANWDDYTYHVVFDDNGGSGGSGWSGATSLDMPLPSKVACPTRTGYTFQGYKVDGATVYYSNGNINPIYTTYWGLCNAYITCTLKAYWQANSYTVTLDRQGGAGGSASVTATYGAAMPSATMPTKTGYAFGGYYTGTDGTGTQYYTASGASARNWDIASKTTLYAYWIANTYTVTLDRQGGAGGSASVTATYGAAMPSATMPTKASYAFLGYFDAATGGTKYYNADGSSAKTWDKTAATTLYAQWKVDDSNWTELTDSTSGKTLSTGYYFISKYTTFSNATAGGSGLSIADNAVVYIYVPADVTLTAMGAAGSGATGGGAGIHVPESATLNLVGSGTVNAMGGNGGNGGAGSNGTNSGAYNLSGVATGANLYWDCYMKSGTGGKGGAGGGGGGAGIGTPGAQGPDGGAGGTAIQTNTLLDKGNLNDSYLTPGHHTDGNKGSAGGNSVPASAMGNLYRASTLTVNATAGAAGTGGAKGNAGSTGCIRSLLYGYYVDYTFGACGGGGGGGGGYVGAAIGAGGASGAGGGGGGTGGYLACGVNGAYYANGGGGAGGVGGTGGTSGAGTVTTHGTMVTGGTSGASGAAGAAGAAKAAGTADAPVYAVTYLDKNGAACGSATYAVGSATKIVLPTAETGYAWKNIVYGKACGSPSDLTSASDAKLTGTINARNVYGDIAFRWTWDEETPVPTGNDTPAVKVDEKWVEANVGKGATAEQVADKLNSTDEANGLKVWQEVALGVAEGTAAAKPAFTGATKGTTGKVAFAVPGYAGNDKSGVTVTRKLVKKVGTDETVTDLALDATEAEVSTGDVSAENPIALYKTVLEFSNGSNGSTTTESGNTVGVMYAKPSAKLAIVAVPWERIGGGAISAADLIDTRDLADGDRLHVYDRTNRKYKTWMLVSGEWSPVGTYAIGADGKVSSENAGDPGEMTIARGDGVWLERGDAANAFHLIGQYNANAATPTVEAGWNLLGNAGIEKANVADLGAGDGDTIIVPTEAEPIRYTKKDGAWGRYVETVKEVEVKGRKVNVKTSEWTTEKCTVDVGQGFWLVKPE